MMCDIHIVCSYNGSNTQQEFREEEKNSSIVVFFSPLEPVTYRQNEIVCFHFVNTIRERIKHRIRHYGDVSVRGKSIHAVQLEAYVDCKLVTFRARECGYVRCDTLHLGHGFDRTKLKKKRRIKTKNEGSRLGQGGYINVLRKVLVAEELTIRKFVFGQSKHSLILQQTVRTNAVMESARQLLKLNDCQLSNMTTSK